MGVDLKVHVYKGFLIAKASWVPTWDPAIFFFEFVKDFFWQKKWRTFILMRWLTQLNLLFS